MKIELFHTPGCERCATAKSELQMVAARFQGVEWFEINVLDALDRAVELGVLTLPAMAIDGELIFPALPTPSQLCQALRKRAGYD
ncbi:MAG: thioredoxin family protein [Betaproteobacteria bacterium]|nr:thioredoxin family protein [Betaproteobacteria bacterium]MDE2623651.1 thioredoxin family protein [Betaproteobacteria bacterium]